MAENNNSHYDKSDINRLLKVFQHQEADRVPHLEFWVTSQPVYEYVLDKKLEYDILDEIYFVQSFESLRNSLDIDRETLIRMLKSMFLKGWIRCYINPSEEIFQRDIDLDSEYGRYLYIASKAGMLAHNMDD